MSDKLIGKITKDFVKKGEKAAPIKSVKVKVKFAKNEALEKMRKGSRE